MKDRLRGLSKGTALIAVGAILGGAVFAVAAKKPLTPAKRAPEPAHSIRDTGVGLPRIHSLGTLGIGEFVQSVRDYESSGSYAADLATVTGQAQAFVERQAKAVRAKGERRCARTKANKGKPREEICKPKLAIVLDIDETALSNYEELNAADFVDVSDALGTAVVSADSPPIGPVLALYQAARQRGIAVFAVTGRPPLAVSLTQENLTAAGYTDLAGLYQKPVGEETIPYKSNARATIELVLGYRIIANIGDQESDLSGGFADRSFKLPNPFYFIE